LLAVIDTDNESFKIPHYSNFVTNTGIGAGTVWAVAHTDF